MSKTTNVTICLDEDLKEKAEHLFNELGLNMTTAINIFLRQCVRQSKIPFELSLIPDYETLKLDIQRYTNKKMDLIKYSKYYRILSI